MPAGKQHLPDPDIHFGAFTVLPRSDGLWAVIDERRKPGERTIFTDKKKDVAVLAAKTWHEQGHG